MNLSYSKVERYLTCPRSYKHFYDEGWRPKITSANLVFGDCIHGAVETCLDKGNDPVATFCQLWQEQKDNELSYNQRFTWEKLLSIGTNLMKLFAEEHLKRFVKVHSIEQRLIFPIGHHTCYGFSDIIADVIDDQGEIITALIDIKTAASDYKPVAVQLNDQLTVYHYGCKGLLPKPERVGYLVFVKTVTPKISWHWGIRTSDDEQEWVAKATWASEQIMLGQYPKHPTMACDWCDFAPLCLGDEALIAETLVQIEKDGEAA